MDWMAAGSKSSQAACGRMRPKSLAPARGIYPRISEASVQPCGTVSSLVLVLETDELTDGGDYVFRSDAVFGRTVRVQRLHEVRKESPQIVRRHKGARPPLAMREERANDKEPTRFWIAKVLFYLSL